MKQALACMRCHDRRCQAPCAIQTSCGGGWGAPVGALRVCCRARLHAWRGRGAAAQPCPAATWRDRVPRRAGAGRCSERGITWRGAGGSAGLAAPAELEHAAAAQPDDQEAPERAAVARPRPGARRPAGACAGDQWHLRRCNECRVVIRALSVASLQSALASECGASLRPRV